MSPCIEDSSVETNLGYIYNQQINDKWNMEMNNDLFIKHRQHLLFRSVLV